MNTTLHKLNRERESGEPLRVNLSLVEELYDLGNAVARAQALKSIDIVARRLPIYRRERLSAREKVRLLFDRIASDAYFDPHRLREGQMLLTAPGAFVQAWGGDKGAYCSCWFELWAETPAHADAVVQRVNEIAGDKKLREQTFAIDWKFMTAGNQLESANFEEIADPDLLDEAYPSLGTTVRAFIDAYLDSSASVLILLGPPGTGKTRLVRAILAALTRRRGENAEVMYTTDKRALASDQMFVEFTTGSHDAFVIEDTDHLLKARTSGNEEMHRFLAIADGIARAQGRKIVFTTNLPNIADIDEALLRPGRCHAVRHLRGLEPHEANKLAERICGADTARADRAKSLLAASGTRTISVAQVYRACG